MRLIEVSFNDGPLVQSLLKATLKTEPLDHRLSEVDSRGRRLLRLTFTDNGGQKAIDAVQAILEDEADWRLVVIPVEATAPRVDESLDDAQKKKRALALREEMYQDITKGARLDSDFVLMTVLSTIVVVFGLSADNIAAVIGAMVIAPLLGPILAFSFGSALGDLQLMLRAARTAGSGLALGLVISFAIGMFYTPNLYSDELMARTVVGLDAPALALASGAAAALSIATGLPATLVGVMVAVALLPPAATAGLLAGSGEWTLAGRAALLLAINVVAVNLSALLVYFYKGVRPRTWLERRSAKRSVYVNLAAWIVMIALLSALAVQWSSTVSVEPLP